MRNCHLTNNHDEKQILKHWAYFELPDVEDLSLSGGEVKYYNK